MSWWHLVILAVIIAVLVIAGISLLLARRLNRLHSNVLKSRRVAEQALAARASAADEFARCGELDIAGSLILTDGAEACLAASMAPIVAEGLEDLFDAKAPAEPPAARAGAARQRRALESELSRVLRLTVGELEENAISAENKELYTHLERCRLDVRMTRKFHNSQVAQARVLHKAFLTRVLHLAGRALMPQTIDIDDE